MALYLVKQRENFTCTLLYVSDTGIYMLKYK